MFEGETDKKCEEGRGEGYGVGKGSDGIIPLLLCFWFGVLVFRVSLMGWDGMK